MPLTWTKDLPTVAGWYWFKKHKSWRGMVVEVTEDPNDPSVLLYDGWNVKYHEAFWAGPIAEPVE